MSALAPDARKLIASSGANFWYPAVTDEELDSEQLMLTNYRRSLGQRRVLLSIVGVTLGLTLWSYIRGGERGQP